MNFWTEVLACFLAGVFTSILIAFSYAIIQWFLHATDIKVSYSWKWQSTNFYSSFDIRNRSGSKTYFLANIEYKNNDATSAIWHDNKSIWGTELKPGTIVFVDGTPIPQISSLPQCLEMQVTIALQTGRRFWLKGSGPGQLQMNSVQQIAFRLRNAIEKAAITME